MYRILLSLFLFVLLGCTPDQASTPTEIHTPVIEVTEDVTPTQEFFTPRPLFLAENTTIARWYIRRGPGVEHDWVDKLAPTSQVYVDCYSQDNGWIQIYKLVNTEEVWGWVHKSALTIEGDCDE